MSMSFEMDLKVNDIVRVVKIPTDYARRFGHALDQVGLVEQCHPDGKRVLFQGLKLPGRPTNHTAWLHAAWLRCVDNPAWAGAVAEYQRYFAEVAREHEERKLRFEQRIQAAADKYGLTVEGVMEIADAVYPMGR